MLTLSRQFFIRLAIIVLVWHVLLAFLPQAVGTCLHGDCSFTGGEIVVSPVIPLAIIALPMLLEILLYRKNCRRH